MTPHRSGIGISLMGLVPTVRCGVTVSVGEEYPTVGGSYTDSMTRGADDTPEWYRYKIEVEGTHVCEYYQYREPLSEDDVAQDWLDDVEESWGAEFADVFRGDVEVTALWQNSTQTTSEAQTIALPPVDQT